MVYCVCEYLCACERKSGCGETVLLQCCIFQSFFSPDIEQNTFKLTNTCAKFNVTNWYATNTCSLMALSVFTDSKCTKKHLKLSTY